MIWLLSQLWPFGLLSLLAGFTLTWLTVAHQRTVRARVVERRDPHAAHARPGSTKAVGTALSDLDEDETEASSPRGPRTVGVSLGSGSRADEKRAEPVPETARTPEPATRRERRALEAKRASRR